MHTASRGDRGFTIIELLLTVAVAATIMGIAVPVMGNMSNSIKLNEAARLVERELHDARIKAVSSNRPLRMRTNCPAAGYVRIVEVLGTSADTAASRCLPTTYPFPAADMDLMTRPNNDGPARLLPNGATVGTASVQFHPDGTAYEVVSGTAQSIASEITITVTRSGESRSITVNSLGKIQLQ